MDLLESEGAEAVMPDLLDFLLYSFYNTNFKPENHVANPRRDRFSAMPVSASNLKHFRKTASDELKASKRFDPPANIRDLAKYAELIVSIGNQTGEGWFLTGEMMELIHNGAPQKSFVHSHSAACRIPSNRWQRCYQGTAPSAS